MVVSWRPGARTNCFVPVLPNGCSAEVGSLTAAWRDAVSKPPTRLRLRSPSPGRAQVQRDSGHLRCPLASLRKVHLPRARPAHSPSPPIRASADGPACWGRSLTVPQTLARRCRARYKYLLVVCCTSTTGGKRVRPQPGAPCTTSPHHHTTFHHRRTSPPSPPSTSPPPRALPPLSFLLLPPPSLVTSPGCPWPATTASSRRHRQPVARTASRDRGDPEARARLDGACGRQDRRSRGSPHGRRAGDGGTSWRQCQATGLL